MEELPLEVISLIINWAAAADPAAARALRRTCRACADAPYERRLFRDPAGLLGVPEYLRAIQVAALAVVSSVRIHDRFDPYNIQDLLLKVPGPTNGRRVEPAALVRYAEASAAAFAHLTDDPNAYMRDVVAAMLRGNGDDELLWDEADLLGDDCPYQTRAVYMLLYVNRVAVTAALLRSTNGFG